MVFVYVNCEVFSTLLINSSKMSSILNSALKNFGFHYHGNKGVDTKMRFSVDPIPGDSGFTQWCAAMQMVSRLPGGIPLEFRKRLWLTLADRHIQSKQIDWRKTRQTCLNEKSNPDDDELGIQIVKDLHRTGCSMFSGEETEHNQALLKKVLLAYARWNKVVGYCQGFNMLAAIILEVMEWQEENALKVMIYLIEDLLPEGYFANHMRGLSVDMAVFRELLRMRFPILSQHLDRLQIEAQDTGAGTSYEPPLTNVFTMQWFLTLFSNCLPKTTVLRVWDLIFLEGNEVLLRTALSIWGGLADRVLTVESADEFYSIMGVLTREMLEFGIMDANDLIKTICTMTPLSISELTDMRDKYAYNIRPLSSTPFSSFKKNLKILYSDDDEDEDDNLAMATWCLSNTMPLPKSKSPMGFSDISPGAVSHGYGFGHPSPSSNNVDSERMSLDISALKKQYAKLRERQKQAHVILTGALANHSFSRQRLPIAVNHLLVGKKPLVRKNKPTSRIVFEFKSPNKLGGEPTTQARFSTNSEGGTIKNRQLSKDLPINSTLSWAEAKLERQKLQTERSNNNDNDKFSQRRASDSSSYSSSSTELCDDDDTPSNCSDYAPSPEFDRKSVKSEAPTDTAGDVSSSMYKRDDYSLKDSIASAGLDRKSLAWSDTGNIIEKGAQTRTLTDNATIPRREFTSLYRHESSIISQEEANNVETGKMGRLFDGTSTGPRVGKELHSDRFNERFPMEQNYLHSTDLKDRFSEKFFKRNDFDTATIESKADSFAPITKSGEDQASGNADISSAEYGFKKQGYQSKDDSVSSTKINSTSGIIEEDVHDRQLTADQRWYTGSTINSFSSRYSSPYKINEREELTSITSATWRSLSTTSTMEEYSSKYSAFAKSGQVEESGGSFANVLSDTTGTFTVTADTLTVTVSTSTVTGTTEDEDDSFSGSVSDSSTFTAHSTALSPSSNSTLVSEAQPGLLSISSTHSLDSLASPANPEPSDNTVKPPDSNSSSPYDSSPDTQNSSSDLQSPEFLDRNDVPQTREKISTGFGYDSPSQVRKKAHSISAPSRTSPILPSKSAVLARRSGRTTTGSVDYSSITSNPLNSTLSEQKVKPDKSYSSSHLGLATIGSAAFSAASKITSGLGERIDFSKLIERRSSKPRDNTKGKNSKYSYSPFPTTKRNSPGGSPVNRSTLYKSMENRDSSQSSQNNSCKSQLQRH